MTNVSKLNLSVRARNCLAGDKIRTVEQLITFSEQELLRVANLGRGTLAEIKFSLAERGLSLREEASKPKPKPKLPPLSGKRLQDWADKVINQITDRHVAALDMLGWKIIRQHDPARRWPFSGSVEGFNCPNWCDDGNPYPLLPSVPRNPWDKAA